MMRRGRIGGTSLRRGRWVFLCFAICGFLVGWIERWLGVLILSFFYFLSFCMYEKGGGGKGRDRLAPPSPLLSFFPSPLLHPRPPLNISHSHNQPPTSIYSQNLAAYDEDAKLCISTLLSLPNCNGMIGATGMCLGGHLAYRCAFDARVAAAVCYFATDIHSRTLGEGQMDDSLERTGEIGGEVVMVCRGGAFHYFYSYFTRFWWFLILVFGFWFFGIAILFYFILFICWDDDGKILTFIPLQIFGKKDNHVPPQGRDLIRRTLHEKGVVCSFYEIAGAQRKKAVQLVPPRRLLISRCRCIHQG